MYTSRFLCLQVVPTMVLGTVLQGRRYSLGEYTAAGLLVLGISLFTLGARSCPRLHSPAPLARARSTTQSLRIPHFPFALSSMSPFSGFFFPGSSLQATSR